MEEGGGKFILFLSLFLTVHINFQYKLKYHACLFIVTFYLFSSIALFNFSHLQFHCFFSLIFDYKFNEYVQRSSLNWKCLILCPISIQERAKINFENKQAKTFFI